MQRLEKKYCHWEYFSSIMQRPLRAYRYGIGGQNLGNRLEKLLILERKSLDVGWEKSGGYLSHNSLG